ncbi:hypothetical protein BDV96DRAFT_639235 [Lophiotrema nucula]|uniref:DUF7580 domain-containing protein n=1 Tax=Lophiotrema nucula TaxID=690887 RepID=A0A6A5ZSI1_9PLEO|nr:hypothetical protein BDV96DRAFT_639235 [Lophiotrema nucula]
MSGLEIAGVVLGALPLIISAFEHYAEGIATAKRFWRYKTEMRSLIEQIKTTKVIFINTMEQLLTGIVRADQMDAFLSRPAGELWRVSEVDEKLKSRLRDAYEIYFDNVRGMEVSLKKIMEKLALDADGKPQFRDPNAFKQEYKRLKFSVSTSEYGDLMSNLKTYNQNLTQLTKQSIDLEPTRTATKGRSCPNFKALQEFAKNLYSTLRSSWSCSCPEHAVNLRLENRVEKFEEVGAVLEQVPFRVIFSYTSDAHPLTWREADIRYLSDKPKSIALSPSSTSSPPAPRTSRRVRFEQIELQMRHSAVTATTSTVAGATLSTSTVTAHSSPTPSQIRDLCKAIARLQQPQRDLCIGYLLDGLQRKHGIYLLDSPLSHQHQWSVYSLKDVLSKSPKVNKRLTQYDKLRVAIDLASSVLQLYKTPWLDKEWTKDDVFFIHRPGAPPTSIYEHPFVCQKFKSSAVDDSNQNLSAQRQSFRVIRNQTLYTLGTMLIELWYGRSIEELQEPSDLDCQGTPGVAWCTAERLVEHELEFEAGTRYSDAVRRCIRCDFDRKDLSLDNESFQHAVYDGVVAPLEKTLQQFNSLD